MAMKLTLVPSEAAESIAARVRLIEQCEAYIKATVARYDGLKSFEAELSKHGVTEKVAAVLKR